MRRKGKTYGRRPISDSESDDDDGVLEAMELEVALSRRYTVNASIGRRVSKRVRYEKEVDQIVEKIPEFVNVGGTQVPIDSLARAVDGFMSNSQDTISGNRGVNDSNDSQPPDEELGAADSKDEDLDDLLLSFGPQLSMEEKDDEDEVDPANVVELGDYVDDNEKVSN